MRAAFDFVLFFGHCQGRNVAAYAALFAVDVHCEVFERFKRVQVFCPFDFLHGVRINAGFKAARHCVEVHGVLVVAVQRKAFDEGMVAVFLRIEIVVPEKLFVSDVQPEIGRALSVAIVFVRASAQKNHVFVALCQAHREAEARHAEQRIAESHLEISPSVAVERVRGDEVLDARHAPFDFNYHGVALLFDLHLSCLEAFFRRAEEVRPF